MSQEKIERILKTYEPVDGMPGYVWISKKDNTVVKLDLLREVYQESYDSNDISISEEHLDEE